MPKILKMICHLLHIAAKTAKFGFFRFFRFFSGFTGFLRQKVRGGGRDGGAVAVRWQRTLPITFFFSLFE